MLGGEDRRVHPLRSAWFLVGLIALCLPACGDAPSATDAGLDSASADPLPAPEATTPEATTPEGTTPTPKKAPSGPFQFQWEFWALQSDALGTESRKPIARQDRLPSGNPIYMRVGLDGSCHLYVLTKGPTGVVEVLHPKAGSEGSETGIRTLLRKRTKLDKQPGKRRYYVVASPEPLTDLEARIDALRAADETTRVERQAAVLAALQGLRKAHEQVTSATSKPASIGGTVRGSESAVEIRATGVYVQTYTIAIE